MIQPGDANSTIKSCAGFIAPDLGFCVHLIVSCFTWIFLGVFVMPKFEHFSGVDGILIFALSQFLEIGADS